MWRSRGTQDASTIDYITFFGWKVINTALLNYALAFAYICVAFLIPILSSIADYTGNKKIFMKLFCYLGSTACCGLFFFDQAHIEWGILLAIVAAIGWCGSLVFYNAYLPEIAEEKDRDKLSAIGYGYGYVGSVILQVICLILCCSCQMGHLPRVYLFYWLVCGGYYLPKSHFVIYRQERLMVKNRNIIFFSNGYMELKKSMGPDKAYAYTENFPHGFFLL
jgi:UMF1 family MFS transporter